MLHKMNKTEHTTIEAYLNKYGKMTYSNIGTSMLPILVQGKDLFTVQKKSKGRCRKYDVVLYRRSPHHYVLHRILQVREKDYVIRGDNCISKEYGITDKDIIAVMTEFVHNGKKHKVTDLDYKIYRILWCQIMAPPRIFIKKLKLKFLKTLGHFKCRSK